MNKPVKDTLLVNYLKQINYQQKAVFPASQMLKLQLQGPDQCLLPA
jgi:hypothetical protein